MASNQGLQARDDSFFINGKRTKIFSGAMHYFRIPREYWKDRLVKLRACGCNAVETYVPWNMHEPRPGEFDFSGFLDLRKYVRTAASCGLYVLIRPGPYICAEWDFGGLPSWLLRDPDMKVRSKYPPFMEAVTRYFERLLPPLYDLQISNGGPIIAFQIENEYGSYGSDRSYLQALKELMITQGVCELFFTSDNDQGSERGDLPDVLMTANFQDVDLGKDLLSVLEKKQPGKPRMVMEFWTGWFDHWGDAEHQTFPLDKYEKSLRYILEAYGNVNFYMFHGGTNFEFRNGANEQLFGKMEFEADVTSYDYDALLDEQGQTTPKYKLTKSMLAPYQSELVFLSDCPNPPSPISVKAYGDVSVSSGIPLIKLLTHAETCHLEGDPLPMEMLPVYNEAGQSYGYTMYRRLITKGGEMCIAGKTRDRAQVFLNRILIDTWDSNSVDHKVNIPGPGKLDILVENMGRTNYCPFESDVLNNQRKGLSDEVLLDWLPLKGWHVFCLDFNEKFKKKINEMSAADWGKRSVMPAVMTTVFNIADDEGLQDTYLDMSSWGKGNVLVNSHNVGRYWPDKGPTKTLYVPGVWLVKGENKLVIFELEKAGEKVSFVDKPRL